MIKEAADGTFWRQAEDDTWHAVPKPTAGEAMASAKSQQETKRMSHGYIPDQGKPEAEYDSFVGVATPFGQTPGIVPNPGGMFTHAGKIMREAGSGVRQLFGDEEYAQETQSMKNIYDKSKHSVLGQIGGEALNVLPFLAGSPAVVGAVGAKTGAKSLQALARAMGRREGTTVPGLASGLTGGAGSGTYHVDPNLSATDQAKVRAERTALGFGLGFGGDLLGSAVINRGLKKRGASEQARQSADLPLTVRTPPARLFPGQSLDLDRLDRLAKEAPLAGGEMATERAKDAVTRPLKDIADNAKIIRKQATGSSEIPLKGAALAEPLEFLRESSDVMYDISKKLDKDAMLNAGDVTIPDGSYVSGMNKTIKDELDVTGLSKFKTGGFSDAVDDILGSVSTPLGATSSNFGPKQPIGSIDNLGQLLKAERDMKLLAEGTFKANQASIARTSAQEIRKTIDEIIGNKAFASADKNALDKLMAADKFKTHYNELFRSNPILRDAVSKKKDMSPQDFSDKLLGVTETTTSGHKQDAINKFMQINPEAKAPLRQELLEQLFTGHTGKDPSMAIDEFVNLYGRAGVGGRGRDLIKSVLGDKTTLQLDNLHKVAQTNTAPRTSPQFVDDTGAWKELAVGLKPDLSVPLRAPLIGELGPQQASDFLFAGRQRAGKPHALGSTRGAGPLADVLATQDNPELEKLMKLLGDSIKYTYGSGKNPF